MIKSADTLEKCKLGPGHRRYTWSVLAFAFQHGTLMLRRRGKTMDNRSAAVPEPVWMHQGKKMKIGEIGSQRLSMKKVLGGMTFIPTVICEA